MINNIINTKGGEKRCKISSQEKYDMIRAKKEKKKREKQEIKALRKEMAAQKKIVEKAAKKAMKLEQPKKRKRVIHHPSDENTTLVDVEVEEEDEDAEYWFDKPQIQRVPLWIQEEDETSADDKDFIEFT